MPANFIEELRWRGMLHDSTPGVEAYLNGGVRSGYIGFDPTSDSLHVGNLVPIMLLTFFQRCGHKPIALVGGATGMVGDPSGKDSERQLLEEEVLRHNQERIGAQLQRFLDFTGPNAAAMVNNYDWFKEMGFLRFIREVGKHMTVNYMMAKDSVKNRLDTGISFTEFSYQLVQGYDYWWLWKHKGCALQMGGSDQWGNIVTGTELIRRMDGGEAYAVTAPLVTKADGSKFGKSESGNVWLDPARTSPYRFHQFWLNTSDEDASRYAHIFTTWTKAEVDALVMEHAKATHLRRLQREVAAELMRRVHGEGELNAAEQAAEILFGGGVAEALGSLTEKQWLDVFDGVPQAEVGRSAVEVGVPIVDLLSESSGFLASKGEARRALKEGSIAVNKTKADGSRVVSSADLIGGRFILLQRGKKNYFLVKVV